MPPSDEWTELIQRVLSGAASRAERDAFQSQVIDGRLLFSAPQQSVEAGRDIVRSVVFVGNQRVQITLDEERLEALREELFAKPVGLPPPLPSMLFVGRDDAMRQIRERLADDRRFLIVRGWPGVAKTTFVSALGRDRRILERFPDGVLWTSLGQSPSLLSALAAWGSALGTDAILRAPTLGSATEKLANLLAKKKMLLLVDDVWDPAHLLPFLKMRGSECVVIMSTRESGVADSFSQKQASIFKLPVLNEEYAIELFQALAPEIAGSYPDEIRRLVHTFECLPLAIQVAARLLATESKYGWGIGELIEELESGSTLLEAQATFDGMSQDATQPRGVSTVRALLQKSTDRLSQELCDCYAFLGVFAPKPATFDLAALSSVWETDNPKSIARALEQRGLLEAVGHGRFQMHALLVAHARSMLN